MIWDFWAPKLASLWASVSFWLFLYIGIGVLVSIVMTIFTFIKAYRIAYVHRTETFSSAFERDMPESKTEAIFVIIGWPLIVGAIFYTFCEFIQML